MWANMLTGLSFKRVAYLTGYPDLNDDSKYV